MPTLFDPKTETYDYVLSTDRDKPKEQQVVFTFRALSKRKWKELIKLDNAFRGAETVDEQFDAANPIVEMGLVKWANWPKFEYNESNRSKLDDNLTLDEYMELVSAVIGQGVTKEDKKKYNSQLDSATESSQIVETVLDSVNAKANQPSTNQ